MAINPEFIDVTTIPNLPTGAFALDNLLPQSNTSGVMTKNTQANFAAFIAPYVAAIGSAGYVPITGLALPTPAGTNSFSLAGGPAIYTHSGGNVTTTGDLNILNWNGTIWSAVDLDFDLAEYLKRIEIDKNSMPTRIGNLVVLNDSDNILDSTIAGDGSILSGYPGAIVSSRLPVIQGKTYWYSSIQFLTGIRFEDKDGNGIGVTLAPANTPFSFTIPNNCVFVRVMLKAAGSPQLEVILSEVYFQYNETTLSNKKGIALISDENTDGLSENLFRINSPMNLVDYGIDTVGNLAESSGGKVSHKIPIKSNNLIDLSSASNLLNKSLDASGNIVDFSDSIVSASMPYAELTKFLFVKYPVVQSIRFEDISGNLISFVLTGSETTYFGTTPSGTKSVRVNTKIQGITQNNFIYFGSVKGEIKYNLSGIKDTNQRAIRFENSTGTKIFSLLTGGAYPFNFLPYPGSKFIRFSYQGTDPLFKKADKTFAIYPFENKRVSLFGDSITVAFASSFYESKIQKKLKASSVERFGVSGGRFAVELQSDVVIDELIDSSPDLVIIHSVNSHRANSPTGSMSSAEGEANEIGGLKKIFNRLISDNKNVKILFCTPLCYGDVISLGFPDSFGSTSFNDIGLYLPDYIKGQLEICRMYGISVVYLTEKCGFRDVVESSSERVYTLDGVHPNEAGYEVMTNIIAEIANT